MPSIQQIVSTLQDDFLSQPDVVSIGAQEGRVIISVVGEEAAQRLNDQLGGQVAGVPVEIQIESQQPTFQQEEADRPFGTASLQAVPASGFDRRFRPVVGGVQTGISIGGGINRWWGTLTGVWRDRSTGQPILVSNRHVWKTLDRNGVPSGATMIQPVDITGDVDDLGVGTLDRWSEFVAGRDLDTLQVDVSGGPATVDAESSFVDQIDPDQFREVTAWRDPQPGERVLKIGARTGVTEGEILTVDSSVKVRAGEGRNVVVEHTFKMSNASEGGDSGSVVVTPDGVVVGQLFAGVSGEATGPSWGNMVSWMNQALNADPVAVAVGGPGVAPEGQTAGRDAAVVGGLLSIASVPVIGLERGGF